MGLIYDLTHTIEQGMPIYPGDPPVTLRPKRDPQTEILTTDLSLGSHTGTHLDTPLHFFRQTLNVSQIELARLCGKALCIPATAIGKEIHLNAKQLDRLKVVGATWILLATGFDAFWRKPGYFTNHPYLSLATARQLVKIGIKGVGIDCPSVDAPGRILPVHQLLLKNDILIVENLTGLVPLKDQLVQLFVLPLKIAAEGAPVRAIALP